MVANLEPRKCILCRQEKGASEFNDEHVIPKALAGYYHIKSVCKACNEKMGQTVDKTLSGNKLLEMKMYAYQIPTRSGIPNPFADLNATLKTDPSQKVTWVPDKKSGNHKMKLAPKMPLEEEKKSGRFSISLDSSDAYQFDAILDKICQRYGFDRTQMTVTQVKEEIDPTFTAPMLVDIQKLKMGLLKIAYEFTVDSVPGYFEDEMAEDISSILLNFDFEALPSKVTFFTPNCFQPESFSYLSFIDLQSDNHHLILINHSQLGIICHVKIFNTIFAAIQVSKRTDYENFKTIVGISDRSNRTFYKLIDEEVSNSLYTVSNVRFAYDSYDTSAFEEEEQEDFDYFTMDSAIVLFKKTGEIAYADIGLKIGQELQSKTYTNQTTSLFTEIEMDEELYIKHTNSDKLHRIYAVMLEWAPTNKL